MQVKVNSFYEGTGYYKKNYYADKSLQGKRVFLRFEGVGTCTEVYVNGKLVGTHKGAYSAFATEIGTALKYGEDNEILVKTDNTRMLSRSITVFLEYMEACIAPCG